MAIAHDCMKRQAHVLALPFPGQGHINPLLDLSRKLAAAGVVVSFINIPYFHSRIAPSLQPLLDRDHLPIRLLSLSDSYPPPPDPREHGAIELCLRQILAFMSKEVEDVIQSLMKQDPSLPPTCLLVDVRIPFAQCLADKFSIGWIAFWTQSAASFSYHVALAEGFRHPTDECAIVDCIPGVPVHSVSDAPALYRREVVGDFLFDFLTKPFLQLKAGALGVVINTFEVLETEALEALRGYRWNLFPVGPLQDFDDSVSPKLLSKDIEEARVEEKHMCLKWLDACKPASVLYISYGTHVCLEESEFEELALGIEGSERSFLWSLRPDMVVGNQSSIEAFKERTKHKGLIVPWVPQLQVLSHASIGGFLTHCGWNSSLESLCRGVPMIGRPRYGDQKLNMMCLVDHWKVCLAMEFKGSPLLRSKVEQSVRTLFSGPEAGELRSSAEKLRSAAACAVAANGSSVSNFKLVLNLVLESEVSA